MNIKPLAQGSGVPAGSEGIDGRSASNEKLARARAIARGEVVQEKQPSEQKQVDHVINRQKIKMKTQRSVYRDVEPIEEVAAPIAEPVKPELSAAPALVEAVDPQIDAESNISSDVEINEAEELKPISPQFAALAKAKRALQEEKRAFETEKQSLMKNNGANNAEYVSKADLKANLLGVLESEGYSRDQIAELLLSENSPAHPYISKLESKLASLEKKLGEQDQKFSERDKTQEEQVLSQIGRDVKKIVAAKPEYEMIKETGSEQDVVAKIKNHFYETGEMLDTEEAMMLVENELFAEAEKIARIKKIQSRINSAETARVAPQPGQQAQMKTLTNKQGASAQLSARERAINAFYGRK